MLKLEDSSIEIPVLSYILWEVTFGMKYSYSDCFIFNISLDKRVLLTLAIVFVVTMAVKGGASQKTVLDCLTSLSRGTRNCYVSAVIVWCDYDTLYVIQSTLS